MDGLESLPNPPQVQVPSWNLDPVASLQCWPVEISYMGHRYTIPAMSALEWLDLIMEDFLFTSIVPGLLSEDEGNIFVSGVLDDEDGDEALYRLGAEVLEQVSARHWWITLRLIGVAKHSWPVLGAKMIERVDASKISLAAWLDVFTLLMAELIKPEKATMLFSKIEIAPQGENESEDEGLEISAQQFLSMATE